MALNIYLALASKINLLLNVDNKSTGAKFISFIPSTQSLEFSYSELNFFNDNEDTMDSDANIIELNRSNFAGIVNLIPNDDIVFNPKDDGYLWDVFEMIVKNNSIVAEVALTTEEKQKLVEAHNFCNENFSNYRAYKNVFDQCQLDYNEAKFSLDYATGDEKNKLQLEWVQYKEKMLQERITSADAELESLGKKTAILSALNAITNLETKKGINSLKTEIKTKFDLFSRAVAISAGTEYLYTDFSPLGSFDKQSPAWNEIELYETEIEGLCNSADDKLVSIYKDEITISNVKSISFEYAVVSVVREWFSEAFLSSPNWNFALKNSLVISDGKVPSSGQIPAFINKIICIRKLSYIQKDSTLKSNNVGKVIFSSNQFKKTEQKNKIVGKSNSMKMSFNSSFSFLNKIIATKNRKSLSKSPKMVIDHRTKSNDLSKWRKTNIANFIKPKPIIKQAEKEEIKKIEVPFDGIKFIAFECKRLALSPNPDMTLVWE